MSLSRYKNSSQANYKVLLKVSAVSVVVAALSGCNENLKDCGGFWDKTFGREACAISTTLSTASISVTPPVVKANVVAIDDTLQAKLSINYPTANDQTTSDVYLTLNNSNNDFADVKQGSVLVIEKNSQLPLGMAAKVVKMQSQPNNQLSTELEYVPLTDVFDSLNVYADHSNMVLDAPVFYPAANISYVPPLPDQVVGIAQKSFTLPNVPKNTVTIDPVKWDANKKETTVGGKISLSFEVVTTENEGRKIRLKENCDKSQYACLTGEIPFETVLSDAKNVEPLAIEINNGEMVKYQSGFQAKVASKIALKLATGKKMAGVPLQLSLADMLQTFWGGTQGTGKSVQDKVKLHGFELSGVPYEDDKIILGTLVFKPIQAALTLGSTGIEVQAGSRNVTIQPALLVTLFMNVKGEIKAEVSAEYELPKYQYNSLTNLSVDYNKVNLPFTEMDFVYPTGVKDFDTKSSFKKIKEDDDGTLKLEAEGEASLTSSMGLDVGLAFLNITPVNSSGEVGGKIKAAGALKWATGQPFEGCISGIQLGVGARMFVDIQTGVKTPTKDVEWFGRKLQFGGGANFAYRWNIMNADKDNDDWALQKVLWQLGEDTCHKPVISAVNWLSGDFVNNQYSLEFDASTTRYTPYIDSMTWDFGDGTTKVVEENDVVDNLKIKHTYSLKGTYVAKLKVKYKNEKEVIASYEFEIKKPAAAIDNYPASGLSGVIGICTTCVEGLTSYDVDWGDGQVESFTMGIQDALHKHAYTSEGTKTVVITFKDKFGNTFQEARTINISKSVMAIQGGTTQQAGQAAVFSMQKVFADATSVFWRFFDSVGEAFGAFLKDVSDKISQVFDIGDYKAVAEIRSGQGLLETVEQSFNVKGLFNIDKDAETSFNDPTLESLYEVQKVGLDTTDGTLRLPLKVGDVDSTFPYIWIANSGEGTISKLDVNTGVELGRYRTGPGNGNPSRTTVDQDGNVWVGNRNNNTITKVGLKEFDNCIDRNGNGVIDTSTGKDDIKSWGGYFGDGQGIANAQDECVLQHIALQADGVSTPYDIRMIAIDKDNNVFTGGHQTKSIFKVDGKTGKIINAAMTNGSFYGGLIDKEGNVWAASRYFHGGVGRVLKVSNDLSTSEVIDAGIPVYGIALDKYGKIWVTDAYSTAFATFNPTDFLGTQKVFYQQNRGGQSCYAQGLAVDDNDNIFIAGCGSAVVGHYKQVVNGNNTGVEFVANYSVSSGPTGVAVDGKGNVWSSDYGNNAVSRITLAANPIDAKIEKFDVGYQPYNYSDMTGRTVRNITNRQGTWEAIFDGTIPDFEWKKLVWTLKQALPEGTNVTAYAKAANAKVELGGKQYAEVKNNQTIAAMKGRFIKVKFQLTSSNQTATPEIKGIDLQ